MAGVCTPSITMRPGDWPPIRKKNIYICFPSSQNVRFLSYTHRSEEKWTSAETHARLKGDRSSSAGSLNLERRGKGKIYSFCERNRPTHTPRVKKGLLVHRCTTQWQHHRPLLKFQLSSVFVFIHL